MKFNLLTKSLAVIVAVAAMAGTVFGPPAVPEVDPGSIGTAVTLLVGGYLVVMAKSRRK